MNIDREYLINVAKKLYITASGVCILLVMTGVFFSTVEDAVRFNKVDREAQGRENQLRVLYEREELGTKDTLRKYGQQNRDAPCLDSWGNVRSYLQDDVKCYTLEELKTKKSVFVEWLKVLASGGGAALALWLLYLLVVWIFRPQKPAPL
ncbi:MAG: hypothetical protein HN353_01300 [Bdellovibrionales bacterium]|jgi:hypothetical protein|nr:hypothetical protein [Bdellovibrionales bacterium]MBT3526695.1 hypothetical protein [Bdellovibrionales bacterium]MBT7668463.1 hypothetical protein [Bdellovibrionales bacterium]MBT7765650.1 hypothetical protein [Bdellovibrionales bacterium]